MLRVEALSNMIAQVRLYVLSLLGLLPNPETIYCSGTFLSWIGAQGKSAVIFVINRVLMYVWGQ